MASTKTIEIVKSTAPVLEQHGETITKVFYRRLFENHPEMMNVFNMTHQKKGEQPRVLANAIFQYATHIDKLEMLGDAVENIAHKHSSLSITEDMYPIVGENLLAAIKEVLQDAATPEIIEAWAEAYGDLADIFVKREEELYTEKENSEGGFRGYKEFVVTRKEKESEVITSFYLKRKDNSSVPKFIPGQYVSIVVDIPNQAHKHTRNYSLSDTPTKEYLRISVKREAGEPDGIVSNYLHTSIDVGDVVSLGMPSGNFVLKSNNNPLVLISGGVGITPLMSMYKTAADTDRPVHFIQCALNSKVRAFKKEVLECVTPQASSISVYSEPMETDINEEAPNYQGFLSLDILKDEGVSPTSDFYFCGPKPFMTNALKVLEEFGVSKENIHYEFFGPTESL